MSDQKDQRAVNEELRKAVGQGDVDAVRQLLDGMADPNCRFPSSSRTVLMEACVKGVRSIVQLLMEKGSSVNETNEIGWTALHLAALKDGHEIARDLLEKQAKVNVVDENGLTPLHLTSLHGSTATARVLMDHDANPNIQDMDGHTLLHMAARYGGLEIVKLLMEYNADPNIQDKNGDTPLHVASSRQHHAILEVLMQHKADPTIKNKRGKYPHELAYNDLRQRLRTYWEEYRRAPLMEMGKVSPKTIKAFVIGSVKAGKTTFTLAVTGTGGIVRVLERTPGINILELELDEFGQLKMHDVAGHDLFHSTHCFFFGGVSALFIYIVDTNRSRDEMLADAIYWLAFIYSGRSPGTPPVYVLILGSRGGDQHQEDRQFTLDSVTRELMKKFEGRFIFLQGKSLVLDMRQTGSKAMDEVKEQLAIGAQNSLKRVSDIPLVCHQIRAEVLPQLRNELAVPTSGKPSGPFAEESQFHALVLKVSDALKDPSLFASLLYYLEEWGEIVVAGDRLVIDTVWLCRSLIGAVFASKADPQSIEFRVRMNAKADGTATLEEIERVLEDFRQLNGTPPVDPKAGIDILQHMGLALPTEKKDVYRFPALIQESRPEQVWMKKESTSAEPHGMVYVGIRLQCQSDIEMFSPAVMPLLQGKVAKQSSEVAVIMWKGGMLVERNSEECQPEVEALVFVSEKTRATRAIDLIARGQTYCQGDVKQFLDKLEQTTMRMLDKKSPGTRVEKRYLNSKQLSQHVEKPVSYSQEEVSVAKKGKGIVKRETGTGIIKDSVIDLLAVDDGHIIYKLQSLSKHCSDHWQELGCILLSSTKPKVIELTAKLGDGTKTDDKFCHVMETWIRRQWKTANLDTFLNACDKVDSKLRQMVDRELTTSDRRLLPNVNIEEPEIIYEEEIGTDREEPESSAELPSDNKIFRAVLKFGVTRWFSIGREMGFTGPQITACTFDIPELDSKLEAIIELKVRECGVEETEKCLLTACKRIHQPIIGAVLEDIESDSEMSQYGSSSISTESAKGDVRLRIRHGATSGDGQSVDSQMGQENVVTGGSVSENLDELNQHRSSDDQHAQPVSPCQPKGHTTAKHCCWSAIIAFVVVLLALLVLWWR